MIILTMRTDKPEAELGLYDDDKQLAYFSWQAHKELAETIHLKIKALLHQNDYDFNQINSIIIYKGPGSFTGLRIGFSVANALASGLGVPIVSQGGENWTSKAILRLSKGDNEQFSVPEYGALPHITMPKH